MIEKLLALFFLTLFLLNLALRLFTLLGKSASLFLRPLFGLNVPENEKKGWELIYTISWLLVGTWAFLELRGELSWERFWACLPLGAGPISGD